MKTDLLKIMKSGLLLILSCLFLSCSTRFTEKQIQNEKFINEFCSNKKVIHNLKKYSGHLILIYDDRHLLTQSLKTFNNDSTEIRIQTALPKNEFYFKINKFILNSDLAFVVLETNDNTKGVVFYLLKDEQDQQWYVMNIEHKNAK